MAHYEIVGLLIQLPSGGEVALSFRRHARETQSGPLEAAALGQRACAEAGLYRRRGLYPLPVDVAPILAGSQAFAMIVDGLRPACPQHCAWMLRVIGSE